jgi:EAL domain-containing protein (putative c-di-GMP-specific phosphodiesterase class I)
VCSSDLQRGLLERMRELFEQTGARPEHLELEITESALITDFESARGWLGLARELGVKISLDDFGTGYSSLAYLKRLPLDAIKIDQSFVVGLEHEGSTVAIVRAMIAMARALGLTIVAEGIENTAQAAILARLGCSIVQGFLYSPAVPATAFERMLQSGRLDPRSERPSSVLGD